MRFIEFIFTCLVMLVIIYPKKKFVITCWVFFAMHFFIDGVRWQLVPVYFIGLLYTLLVFSGLNLKNKGLFIPSLILSCLSIFYSFSYSCFLSSKTDWGLFCGNQDDLFNR